MSLAKKKIIVESMARVNVWRIIRGLKAEHRETAIIPGGGHNQKCSLKYLDSFIIQIRRINVPICSSSFPFLVFSEVINAKPSVP